MTDTPLLVNLVFALLVALGGAIVAVRLRQSVIVGYILGGILIGPHTPGFVSDVATVEALANIGVVLLMFTVGLQFSLQDLARVGRVAILGAILQLTITVVAGYWVGRALGWAPAEAIVLGAAVGSTSSVALSKVLSDLGEMGSDYGRIALAWSAVQDLGTVMLIVLLTAVAGTGESPVPLLLRETGKTFALIVVAVVLGTRVVPRLFDRLARYRNREIFLLAVATVALGFAYAATYFGVSLALGALVAGMVASGSDLTDQILGSIQPLRDIFAGLFFVSVGMLLNPGLILEHLPLVLLILFLIVVLKGVVSAGLTWLFLPSFRTAVLVGVSLAIGGELAFVVARYGTELGVVSPEVFSLSLAAIAASLVLGPSMISGAVPALQWAGRRLPLSSLASHAALSDPEADLRGHAVICGFGRVGRVVGDALQRRGFRFVVVDHDPRVVRPLREKGVIALLGDADNPVLLDRVRLDQARLLVVAIPDPLATRLIVDYAHRVNPRLDIVARAHSVSERAFLAERGATETVVGELELALEMTRFALHRFGVGTLETQAFLQSLRLHHELDTGPDGRARSAKQKDVK